MDNPWEQVYAKDVPPDFDEMRKREDRKERIKPFWDLLVMDKEPKVNKDALVRLMHDLKEEGNALFKEAHYDIAWMHYRNAIFVVRILENRFYHSVEKEFTSSLFSNRAFCCLKKNMFKEAVKDCESAIGFHSKNLKAYYRQALAYKHLEKYPEAYKAACEGQAIQPSSALKDLIEELEPHVKGRAPKVTAEVSAKAAAPVVDINNGQRADQDWLAGTNFVVTEKHLEAKKMPTKKAKKNKKKSNANHVKVLDDVQRDEEGDSDGTSNSFGVEDDEEFAHVYSGVQQNKSGSTSLLNGHPVMGGLDIITPKVEEESAWSFPHDSDMDEQERDRRNRQAISNMGLDSFSPEMPTSDNTESELASHSTSSMSSGRTSRASESPAKGSVGTPRHSSAAPSPVPEPVPAVSFPLTDFDFKIVCNLCFSKIGEGSKGYRYVNASHSCQKDVLIVKKRNTVGMNWMKIRYRPDSKMHYGAYKICQQFQQGKACKVGEEMCTFPHHQAEVKLWTMDRDGTFNIFDFVTKCRTFNLNDSTSLEGLKTKPQYIPGLNYVENVKKKGSYPPAQRSPQREVKPAAPKPSTPQPALKKSPQHEFKKLEASQPSQLKEQAPLSKTFQIGRSQSSQGTQQNRYVPVQSSPQMPPVPQQVVTYAPCPQYGPEAYFTAPFTRPPPPLPNTGPVPWSRQVPTVFQEPEPQNMDPVVKLDNPLAATHKILVACPQCFKPSQFYGVYNYMPLTHKCEETLLGIMPLDGSTPWLRIRERKNHREFRGNYILCRSVTYKNAIFCKYGEENCSFAHSKEEQYLWALEKDGKFNITEFIIQNRKQTTNRGFTLEEILVKHGGYFEFICRSCYYGSPPKLSVEGSNARCIGNPPHDWKTFETMAHVGPSAVTIINPRGFLHKTAFFKICKWLKFCRNKVNAECRFAHSMIERDVWMLERDCGIDRPSLVLQSKQQNKMEAAPPQKKLEAPSDTKAWPAMAAAAAAAAKNGSSSSQTNQIVLSDSSVMLDNECPVVVEVCETCWKKGQKTPQHPGKDRCQRGHANWSCNVVYLIHPSNKELRPLPKRIPSGLNFIVCKYIRDGHKCGYKGSGPCQFAHSNEELDAWKYMCMQHPHLTQAQLSESSRVAQKARAESAKAKISGQSVVAVHQGSLGAVRPTIPVANVHNYYCHYCGISCNSQKQWDEHCASEKHNFNVNSDKEHQWNYRQPPWTTGHSYELCARHQDGHKCQYSNVPEMYNLCRNAHSQEELDEWQERYQWRQMKREIARQEKVFSYMDQLLEKYENSQSSVKVKILSECQTDWILMRRRVTWRLIWIQTVCIISEELDGVEVKIQGELHIYKEEKNASNTWTFDINSVRNLQKVALFHNRDRLHFSLIVGNERSCQIAPGEIFAANVDHQGKLFYRVRLRFTGGMFGSFQQWILFDFGTEPVVCRKISVEVGNQSSHEKVRNLRKQLKFDRWTGLNREVLRQEVSDVIDESLLTKYKEPVSSESVVTQTTVSTELNRHNYVPKMHKMLELEEMTRHQIISSYNLCAIIDCLNAIQEEVHVYAKPGELFAKVPLQEHLTEDTDAGKLILSSVRKVYLAPQADTKKMVYEAAIVREENFNYDGRGREYIYLCLSPHCVKRLGLKPGKSLEVEIQFQMDRLFFCRMHYAVDKLQTTDIVFPDVPKINPLRNEKHNLRISSSVLNPDQLSAVRHIVAQRIGYTPPFIMFGPFGTGKTETIAQATMVLLKETRDTRILICAQSNSAADLYIVKHFDTYLRKAGLTDKLRRIYFKERRVYTVAPEVKKYCLLTRDEDSFEMPTKEDIEKHRIVIVTVTTSLLLTGLGLHGSFSHIFVDEAAQTLECEGLMPLSLATEKTCIVLAGDHMQISPKVYSEEARNQKFHQSLLERMYNYYESHASLISETSPLNILLSINYRTKMEILRFIAAVFYGGPDTLKSEGNIKSVVTITPLVFHTVQGREVQDENSITYYNMSEVQEVVERVDELYEDWPEEWGPQAAREIGVVTPYFDQVQLIRKALKKRNPALREVVVERVQGIQGREFRAMFISTVRTRHLIEANHVQCGGLTDCDGDGGDFGFLSDPKLLNTALTRAQSLVVVVGDPVALCAIGECVNVWRTYLKHCQNMKSLLPLDHNFESIRQQVQNLLNSPAREKLLEIANEKQTQKYQAPAGLQQAKSSFSMAQAVKGEIGMEEQQQASPQPRKLDPMQNGGGKKAPLGGALGLGLKRPLPLAPLNSVQQKPVEDLIELGVEYSLDPDDVILQLAKQASGQSVAKGNIQVREERGHAVLYCDSRKVKTQSDVAPRELPTEQLISLLSDQKRYLRCVIHIDAQGQYAKTLSGKRVRIEIQSRWLCGRANNQDEVVIELTANDNGTLNGKVVGVLKPAEDLKTKYIVCEAAEDGGVMVPLNAGLPAMLNLTTSTQFEKNGDGGVTVYKITKTRQVRFNGHEQLNPGNLKGKLFVAKFLRWERHLPMPLCIVVGVIPNERSILSGIRVIDFENAVMKDPHMTTVEEVDFLYPNNFQIMSLCTHQHMDLRDRWCFTIDLPGRDSIDRAFSIDENGDGSYQVGVHVADVASFVKKKSGLDEQACKNSTSLFPVTGKMVSMLPSRLSTQLCNLKPNEDRLAISVLMTVQNTGEITQVTQYKSIINCKKQYTYAEAEQVLHDPNAHEDYLKSCILVLFEISRIWRKERLGNAAVYQEHIEGKVGVFTQQLVQEMVIMTQYHIARLIMSKFPFATPLYIQSPPTVSELNVWKKEHAADAINSVALTKPFLNAAETCKCCLACTHTVNYVVQCSMQKREHIEVFSVLWDALNEAVALGDHNYMQNIIVAAENHPQLAVALDKLQSIQYTPEYMCSADVPQDEQYHYSVNHSPYISIAHPLSCFMDIVVQRMLLAILDSLPCPYTHAEIKAICSQIPTALRRQKMYEEAVLRLHVSCALVSHPVVAQPMIQALTPELITFCFPALPVVTSDEAQIELTSLGVCEPPAVGGDGHIVLKWQERVYDASILQTQKPVGSNYGELNPDRFIYKISPFQWQRLLIAIREQNEQLRDQKLNAAVETVRKQVSSPALESNYIEEVTSEGYKLGRVKHFTEFTLAVRLSQVLQVQVTAGVSRGVLSPCLQLLNLTPRLDICLQHQKSPQKCFVGEIANAVNTESISICPDTDTYQKLWSPVVDLESVSSSIASNESLVMHNVPVNWKEGTGSVPTTAQFRLSVQFMKERSIKIHSNNHLKELFHPANARLCKAYFSDFVCVRYSGITLPVDKGLHEEVAYMVNNGAPCTWVGHGVVTDVGLDNDHIIFHLKLIQSDIPLPRTLIQKHEFTVQLITRKEKDMHIAYALESVREGSKLMKNIILRQELSNNSNYSDVDQLKQSNRNTVNVSNQQQEDALTSALAQPLTVINGAMATGKTSLAVKLAVMYTQRNNGVTGGARPQVLVCASSEVAVDVLNDFFLSLPNCPSVVRIYSSDIESLIHPLPRDITRPAMFQNSQFIDQIKSNYSTLSLYEKVRSSGSMAGRSLTEFDTLFSLYPDDISDDQYEDYLQLVLSAETTVIRSANIILCTCTTSGLHKLIAACNIRQIIIDDASACTEPEVLVPMSLYKDVEQVTLLGDLKQLQPSVVNHTAKALGLGTPLMNAYIDNASSLSIQYRIHEGIMEFPSEHSYGARVLCGSMGQRQPSVMDWPGGRSKPAVFCQLEGVEEKEALGVTYPNHQTIRNLEQANFAVRIAVSVASRYQVAGSCIIVLASTRAQATCVQEQLYQIGSDIRSFTVEETQGREYDYIVYTTVRTLPKAYIEVHPNTAWKSKYLGTLKESSLTNVAITRAKKGLVIIGNSALLRCDEMWNRLLCKYEANKMLVPANTFLQAMSL